MTISDFVPADLSAVREMDEHVVHPWESFDRPNTNRTIISSGAGVYVYDYQGNRLLDGPGGMWCVNVGHGRQEIADAMADQAAQLSYISPWSHPTAPAARLADRLSSVAPGDLDHVFYTTGGSTAIDSALRFCLFYNNVLGRPEKKHIITRHDAYHGSTYLSAAVCGKPRDKNWLDTQLDQVHFVSSPNSYRSAGGLDEAAFCQKLIAELEGKILEVGPERVAAFIAEPSLGQTFIYPVGRNNDCIYTVFLPFMVNDIAWAELS